MNTCLVSQKTQPLSCPLCAFTLSVTLPRQGSDSGKNTQTADYPQRSLTVFSSSSPWGQHPKWWICWRGLIKGYFRKEGHFHKVYDKSCCCCCLVTKSYLTLCDPMNCSPPDSFVHEFPKQEYCSGLPFPSSGDLSDPGIKPGSPTLQADSLLSEPPRKADMIRGSYP